MHIIHVVLHFPTTKLEYQEVALAREQIRLGYKVSIVTSDWHNNYSNYNLTYKPIIGERYVGTGVFFEEGIQIIRLKLRGRIGLFSHLKGLKKTLKKLKPDLIICHGFEVGLLPLQSFIKGVKMVVDSHFAMVQDRDSKNGILKAYLKKNINNALLFISGKYLISKGVVFFGVTEDSVKNIRNKGKVPYSKLKLIPLAVNRAIFFPSKNLRFQQRSEFNLTDNDVLLCITGKLEEYKGAHLILEAMLKVKYNNLFCLIVGSGSISYKKRLDNFCNNHSLTERVFFKKFSNVVSLNKYFNASDIAVYPKSVSISHIEAMSVGLPIIIEDLTCIKHRITNNNGFTIENGDIKALTNYIQLLCSDFELRKKMGKTSLDLVQTKLNWESINNEIIKFAYHFK